MRAKDLHSAFAFDRPTIVRKYC